MSVTLTIAREYVEAGVSVIPLRLDGSKAPAIPSWAEFQERMPSDEELGRWFNRPAGIAIVCGKVSHGIEVIDFDDWECFEPWKDKLPTSLTTRLSVVETAGGGFHVPYRCQQIAGNTKLAKQSDGRDVRIETRGQGGFIVAVGSPLEVHSSGEPYVQVAGPVLPELPTITPDERKQMWEVSRSFDLSGMRHPKVDEELKRRRREAWEAKKAERPDGEIPPWEDFDERGDFSFLNQFGELRGDTWCRDRDDGKPLQPSAVIRRSETTGQEVLVCYSTSLPDAICPKAGKPSTAYGKAHVYKTLVHKGDWLASAKDLYRRGYGTRYGS